MSIDKLIGNKESTYLRVSFDKSFPLYFLAIIIIASKIGIYTSSVKSKKDNLLSSIV